MKLSVRLLDIAGLAIIASALAFLFCGCAHFQTSQTDIRYDPDTGHKTGQITTRATAFTVAESKSQLANFKATQTEKTQGASVGSLAQDAGGTNTAATISALVELLKNLR